MPLPCLLRCLSFVVSVMFTNPSPEIVRENSGVAVSCSPEKLMPCEEQLKENKDSLGVSDYSDEAHSSSLDEVPRLPILKKIDVLENKVKKLRKEQTVLSNQVKDFTANTFPGSEVVNALRKISRPSTAVINHKMGNKMTNVLHKMRSFIREIYGQSQLFVMLKKGLNLPAMDPWVGVL